MMFRIPLSAPTLSGLEALAASEAVRAGHLAQGPEVEEFERALATRFPYREVVACSSGTAALHVGLRLAGVGPGDMVCVPTLTFQATAAAVSDLGAVPVFMDVLPDDWTLCGGHNDARCQVPVDLYGVAADLSTAADMVANMNGVATVEDAAEALGCPEIATGSIAALSFNGNKVITCGGGGALVLDPARVDVERARRLISHCREPVAWYDHREVGYNYRMPALCAAVGMAQLQRLEQRVEARRAIHARYVSELSDLITFQAAPPGTHPSWWLTAGLLSEWVAPDTVIARLAEVGIECRRVWKPLNLQPCWAPQPALPVAEDIWRRGICLPSSAHLTDDEQGEVITELRMAIETV